MDWPTWVSHHHIRISQKIFFFPSLFQEKQRQIAIFTIEEPLSPPSFSFFSTLSTVVMENERRAEKPLPPSS
jgi:hypothetical protein